MHALHTNLAVYVAHLLVCRSPAHCIEYAHLILWGTERPGLEFDADCEEHMNWVFDHALQRAQQYGIQVGGLAAGCIRDRPDKKIGPMA